ncbi:heme-copper oxidase subunit III [Fontisphaera persica]|uniref:cytochrome c oxidase subunit 3 n=1 Tax=Fontisphaera persica TaxID=2974023 RepID=UPI0024BF9A94|nr:heme-copper oxidase subunit III [Fontisphaera persica]WCJ58665.1 heme-copper oxidase subunit III [Fontisphaera persica]
MSSAAMEIPYTVTPRRETGLYNGKLGIWMFIASEVMLFGALFSSYAALRTGADFWPTRMMSLAMGTMNTAILISSSILVVMGWTALKLKQFDKFKLYQGLTLLCAVVFLCIKGVEYRQKFIHYEVWLTDQAAEKLAAAHPHHEQWLKEPGVFPGRRSITGHLEGNPWLLTHKQLKAKGVQEITLYPDVAAGGHAEPLKIAVSDIFRMTAYAPAHSSYFAIYYALTGLHALHVIGGIIVMFYLWGPGRRMWFTEPERFTNRIECSVVYWHFVDFVWLIVFPLFYLF